MQPASNLDEFDLDKWSRYRENNVPIHETSSCYCAATY